MDMEELFHVNEMSYTQYCDYLQNKYGIGLADYMTQSFNKSPAVSRGKEGLFAHHKMEDCVPNLSNPKVAKLYPVEWQAKENIIYCDYLEHFLLHLKIRRSYGVDHNYCNPAIENYMIPELNDYFSGYVPPEDWKRAVANRIKDNKEVYLQLLTWYIHSCSHYGFSIKKILTSNYYKKAHIDHSDLFKEIVNIYSSYWKIICRCLNDYIQQEQALIQKWM